MPRRPKSTKNSRRIQSAEQALAATQRKQSRQPRKRVSRLSKTTRNPSGFADSVRRYRESVLKDVLLSDVRLPSMSVSSPYNRLRLSTRYTPTADLNGGFCLLINPNLAFTDSYIYQVGTGGAAITQTVPTLIANGSGSSGFPTGAVGGFNPISLDNQVPSHSDYGFYGQVRCHGVMVRIDYTGPNNTKGGELLIFHNGRNAPAIYQSTSATVDWQSGYNSPGAMADATSQFSSHYMGTSFRHVWRPLHIDFENYTTYRSRDLGSTSAEYNVFAAPEIAMPTSNTVTPLGWTSGFYCKPATTVTAGNVCPYLVTVEIILDITVFHGQSNVPVIAATERAMSDPAAAAHVNNTLAELHHTRATNVSDLHTGNTGLEAFASRAIGGVEDIAKQFTADMLTRAMASAFGGT